MVRAASIRFDPIVVISWSPSCRGNSMVSRRRKGWWGGFQTRRVCCRSSFPLPARAGAETGFEGDVFRESVSGLPRDAGSRIFGFSSGY